MDDERPVFIAKHLPAIKELGAFISKAEPDLFLGIARKGPRLAELAAKYGAPILPAGVPMISERALPFLEREELRGRRVIVFDDIVIWGSTMRDTVAAVEGEGAEAIPVSLAASTKRERSLVPGLVSFVELEEDETIPFSTELVEGFHLLGKPYNIDHPILEIRSDRLSSLADEDILEAASSHLGTHVFRLSGPVELRHGIRSYVLNRPELTGWQLSCAPTSELTHFYKIRLFRSRTPDVLRIEPILIFRSRDDALLAGSLVCAATFPSLGRVFDTVRGDVTGRGIDNTAQLLALYTLQMYLAELALGSLFLDWLKRTFGIGMEDSLAACLPAFDIDILFGANVSHLIRRVQLAREIEAVQGAHYQRSLGLTSRDSTPTDLPILSEDAKALLANTHRRLRTSLSPSMSLEDNVSFLLNSLRDVDTKTRDASLSLRGRLNFGYTLDEIRAILTASGIKHEDDELSSVIDYLVDTGVGVPLVQARDNGIVDRVIRFGEAGSTLNTLRYVVRSAFWEAIDRTRRGTGSAVSSLPTLLTDKALALVAIVGQDSGQLPVRDIAVKLVFRRYGAELVVEDVLGEGRLLRWAISNGVLVEEGNRLRLNNRFDQRCPPRESPLSAAQKYLIAQTVYWFVDASIETKDSANRYATALAVTTCRNAKSTIEAIEGLVRLWFSDPGRPNAHGCLDRLYQLTALLDEDADVEKLHEAIDDLDKSCRQGPADLMSQCELKLRVFRKLPQTRAELNNLYSRDKKPGLDDFYTHYVERLLNPTTSRQEERRLLTLEGFAKLCQSWTSVLRSSGTLVTRAFSSRPANPPKELDHAIREVNRCADELEEFSSPFCLKTRLPEAQLSSYSKSDMAERIRSLQDTLQAQLGELETLAGSALLETSVNRPPVEPLGEDRYVITYDWIHSTGTDDSQHSAEQRRALNERIVPFAIAALEERECTPTGNDENCFIVNSLRNASRLTDRLLDSLEDIGQNARIAVTSTRNREKLFHDGSFHTYCGQAFVIAARIRDLYKEDPWMHDGRSHVLVDGVVVEELRGLDWGQRQLSKYRRIGTDKITLRGKGLPEVELYEYDRELP